MIPLSWVLALAGLCAAGLLVALLLPRAAEAADRHLAEVDLDEATADALAVVADDQLVERMRVAFDAQPGAVVDTLLDVLGRACADRDEARHDAQVLAFELGAVRDELDEWRSLRDAELDAQRRAA